MGDGPNDAGLSRQHLITECEASLRRLGTDHIDLYQVHEWDGVTPLEETLAALDDLVRSGKVRYVGCSNYAGWQLMKALGISERRGLERFVRPVTRSTSSSPSPSTRGWGSWCGARWRAVCSPANTAATGRTPRARGT
jgi:aryl-alcohol dehydrogenase-like predicted oxidoreductase